MSPCKVRLTLYPIAILHGMLCLLFCIALALLTFFPCRFWISEYPVEFDLNPALADQIKDLRENLNTGGNETQSQLIDVESV